MLGLNLSSQALDVQKHVVIEEFKQRYLNAPYGDIWLKLRPLAYQVHPYRWPTIGISPEHIEKATEEDVKTFFREHYTPDNAIVGISGNIAEDKALKLVQKMVRGYSFLWLPATSPPTRTYSNRSPEIGFIR